MVETSFQQNAGLESILAILLKTDFTTGIFWHGLCKVLLFEISKNFRRGITAIPFVKEVATLRKMNCLEYIVYRTNSKLSNRQCLYLNVDADADANVNANAEMPMPRFPNGPIKNFVNEKKTFYVF